LFFSDLAYPFFYRNLSIANTPNSTVDVGSYGQTFHSRGGQGIPNRKLIRFIMPPILKTSFKIYLRIKIKAHYIGTP